MNRAAVFLHTMLRLPQHGLILLVRAYRLLLKPWVGNACRFEPSCSAYALEALQRHGALAGSALSSWRLLRCHPWCDGGCDPVPATFAPQEAARGLFTRWTMGVQAGVESSGATAAQRMASTATTTATTTTTATGITAQRKAGPPACAANAAGGADRVRGLAAGAQPNIGSDPKADRPTTPALDRSSVTPSP